MRSFDATLPRATLRWAAAFFVFAGTHAVFAQTAPQPQPPISTRVPALPGAAPGSSNEDENPMARQLAEQQAIRRNKARQKQIVDDTAKLLHLAQQLKDEADKGKAGHDAKKAEEIEKLAKSVKERMREGQ
jgi:hypothetical protein